MGRQQAFEDAEKVEILADQFENTSKRSRRQGTNNLNKTTPDNYKHWNNNEKEPLLKLRDIQRAVSELKSGATGNDRVHNNMLKALPIETMQIILELFNKSLNEGVVPQIWKHAIIHPILKPGKDPKDPASYRPISLLSCLAKLLERAIKAKTIKALKGNIQIEQCGFYEGRSTTDTLIRLEHHVKKGFLKKRHTLKKEPDPDIFLNGLKIRCTESFRYLGVLLDSQLTWEKHIEELITAVDRRKMLINAICNKKYKVPRDVLMQFSKAIILGKIDYASLVYASAKKTILAKLNAKWNETLRRTTNALKSTPIPALHIETSTTSLPTRRKILMAKYLLKKRGTEQEDIIKNEIIMDPYLMDYRFEIHNTPSLVKLMKDYPTNMSPLTIPTDKKNKIEGLERNISWKIHEEIGQKSRMSEQSLLQFALSELENYRDYRKFFTDGSKIGSRTGCGIWDDYKKLVTQYRLSDHTSIYMAELFAIDTAIKEIVREGKEGKYLVCTDSLSCLKYLKVAHEQAPTMARDIVQNIRMIEETGSCVSLIWIPAHVGVSGNERADQMAKDATKKETMENTPLPHIQTTIKIDEKLKEVELEEFRKRSLNMYLEITEYRYINHEMKHPEKRVADIIFRMRTGHARTKNMLKRWNMTDSSDCNVCGVEENLQHIIMECKKYETARSRLKEQILKSGIQFRIKELLGKVAKDKQRETVRYLGQYVKDTGLIDVL
ncbi:hypothetical protein QYM36_002373 [Artemia franciscana]|uniref:RNase H type-1 domain-containing protein n=1 Tax=Artemia franciscana TaxID=6661 RepID=A0AA88I9P0_ARTSF|nr:hypothetical protein QYM36_002373 [Artemia franciscana]